MYTIGQFSKICRVTAKAIRHYEKMGLISPARVDVTNRYRYYSREQVLFVRKICLLKDLGFPLRDVKRIIDNKSGEGIESFLEEHRLYLIKQLDLCSSRLVRLAGWQKSLEDKEMNETSKYEVTLREVPEVMVRSLRKQVEASPDTITPMLVSVLEEIISLGAVCAGPPVTLFYDEEFNAERADVEVCWPVADSALAGKTLPAVRAATCMHVGPYDGLEKAYQALFDWINKNNYRAVYPVREVSHTDPRTTPAEQLVTEIIMPVVK